MQEIFDDFQAGFIAAKRGHQVYTVNSTMGLVEKVSTQLDANFRTLITSLFHLFQVRFRDGDAGYFVM